MAIITISRGSYSYGRKIAEEIAKRKGYDCIAREILLEASEQFDTPEIRLAHAIHDVPNLIERLAASHSLEKYLSYIRLAFFRHLRKDNVVYHGLAGHFFVLNVKHILKVRIVAPLEQRIKYLMSQEALSEKEAITKIEQIDKERHRWSHYFYGIDTEDMNLYDLVVNTKCMTIDDAVDIICDTVEKECFRSSMENRQYIDNIILSEEANYAMQDFSNKVIFTADGTELIVHSREDSILTPQEADEMEKRIKEIPGVESVTFKVNWEIGHTNPFHNV